MASILAEFDAEEYAEMLKRESMEDGGTKKIIELVCKKLRKNKTPAQIADELEEELSVIQEVCEVARNYAPEYEEEKIYQEIKNR